MTMFAGTVTTATLLERATTTIPEAAPFRVTVQVVAPPLRIDDGLQLNELTCLVAGFTVTVASADPL
jgi:hypothetical protein